MRQRLTLALLGAVLFYEPTPADRAKLAASVTEVPVIPDEPSGVQEPPASEASGEVQERGVARVAPGAFASGKAVLGVLAPPSASGYPGEFAFRTQKGYYLTAINGGGRPVDPTIITGATSAGAWEKFKLTRRSKLRAGTT